MKRRILKKVEKQLSSRYGTDVLIDCLRPLLHNKHTRKEYIKSFHQSLEIEMDYAYRKAYGL